MSVLEYIEKYPQEQQDIMLTLRQYILSNYPQLKEKISWGMPTYYLHHNIIHFAMHKHHLGIYPGGQAMEIFEEDLQAYPHSKGAFQVLFGKDIPYDLISKMIEYNIQNVE